MAIAVFDGRYLMVRIQLASLMVEFILGILGMGVIFLFVIKNPKK